MAPPFLKWAGGKRWLAPTVKALVSQIRFRRYIEPFVGGGALFFLLTPRRALLSDLNKELVDTYIAVRDEPEAVIKRLSLLPISRRTFAALKKVTPKTPLATAVRLIYLNRTAFNGLYRVNQQGHFNVPFGCKKGTKPCDPAAITSASVALKRAVVSSLDFREILRNVREHDLVYLDPPYTATHNDNGFRRYNEKIFSWADQRELARLARLAAKRGAHVIVSNACHREVRRLYTKSDFYAFKISRMSCIAAEPTRRVMTDEVLIVSKSLGDPKQLLTKMEGFLAGAVAIENGRCCE
jgi:DNA adenine methylase